MHVCRSSLACTLINALFHVSESPEYFIMTKYIHQSLLSLGKTLSSIYFAGNPTFIGFEETFSYCFGQFNFSMSTVSFVKITESYDLLLLLHCCFTSTVNI